MKKKKIRLPAAQEKSREEGLCTKKISSLVSMILTVESTSTICFI